MAELGKQSRRVIGKATDGPNVLDSPTLPENPTELRLESIKCPICEEEMVNLLQLNRHLDDIHGNDGARKSTSPSKAPQRRTIKLDLYDNNMGFGLSDNLATEIAGKRGASLSRSHWKQPSSTHSNVCSHRGCKTVLNVKNGVVNCRKCGRLFCDRHTSYRARLSNDKPPQKGPKYDPAHGQLAICCEKCFFGKPDMKEGTQVNMRDLSGSFQTRRSKKREEQQWERLKLQRRLIKLVGLLTLSFLWHEAQKNLVMLFFSNSGQYSSEKVLQAEKEIVGVDNWQNNNDATHCPLCFVRFNFLIRKHHCRLCGRIVSDEAFNTDGANMQCSLQVPVSIILQKLPNLNYSSNVKEHWPELVSESAQTAPTFSFRCCRECKNHLLHGVSLEHDQTDAENDPVLFAYDEMLVIKTAIQTTLPKYAQLVHENKDTSNHQINRLRVKLRKHVKDFEIATTSFRHRFFKMSENSKFVPTQSPVLVTNVYKMAVVFLQESILEFKKLSDLFQQVENDRLSGQLGLHTPDGHSQSGSVSASPMSPAVASPRPRLTKKQIRELREELMVISEQKFLVEQQMENAKKLRRFDELLTLTANSAELQNHIDKLETELGEFAFA